MAQLVAALIMVHGLLSFLPDVYDLLDPSGKTLWLSVDHCRLAPVDDMIWATFLFTMRHKLCNDAQLRITTVTRFSWYFAKNTTVF